MNMSTPALDRLIEEGLALYGRGDLDAALEIWERVLGEDPGNEQATSYVDYVRMNYDMLTSDARGATPAPFGIADDDEPEYLIEISAGELPAHRSSAPMYMDPTDQGWMIEDDMPSGKTGNTFDDARTGDEPIEPIELELEADEPPPLGDLGLPIPPPPPEPDLQRAITANGEVSFDDDTREYEGRMRRDLGDFAVPEPVTNEFTPEGTPGFGSAQITDVKRRDFGFVKPRAEPPELKMTLRTPQYSQTVHDDPTKEVTLQPRATEFERSYAAAEPWTGADDDELAPPSRAAAGRPAHITRDLPPPTVKPAPTQPPLSTTLTPRSSPTVPPRTAAQDAIDSLDLELGPSDLSQPVSPTAKTRDLVPENLHISFSSSATRDFASAMPTRDVEPQIPTRDLKPLGPTRDFTEKPTLETPRPAAVHDPVISAPTRELGLRSLSRAQTEDEPTQMNKRIRPELEPLDAGGTRADIVLPFDPIDARAAQILAEVDAGAPADELEEDRTRRRISALLERATQWLASDLERAVAAVDLALAENPNSALAQKLIHRNRDTIMSVFQGYMGDLDRQPRLARPLHELASAPISPRAAFLLSRVDGSLTLDEILDVSGMPRLEAYRYLAQLFLRGILR